MLDSRAGASTGAKAAAYKPNHTTLTPNTVVLVSAPTVTPHVIIKIISEPSAASPAMLPSSARSSCSRKWLIVSTAEVIARNVNSTLNSRECSLAMKYCRRLIPRLRTESASVPLGGHRADGHHYD